MALNKLVGGDCGGNNSLIQLSNIVNRDAPLPISQSDRFVNEFMAQNSQIPDTFNMNALLNNIPDMKNQTHQNIPAMTSQRVSVTSQGNSAMMLGAPSTSFFPMHGPGPMSAFPVQHNPMFRQHIQPSPQIQYINESDLQSTSDNVQAKAQEYVNSIKEDDELAYNQFMSFMKRVSAGELNINESTESEQNSQKIVNEMAEKYKDEWAKLSNVEDYWSSEAANGISKEYSFTEGNVMVENKSALEIGKEKLKMGDIPGAVLCFEAAAQQQPESAEVWFLLGTTQAENEQDPMAITALKKSLEIDPRQLEAYITLAAAYTNENMPKFAYTTLVNWLKASPKYNDLIPQDIDPQAMNIKELDAYVMSLYLKAVQLNPTQIDPDIQNALGVIFNINQEYDKAVDCFKTALMVSSDNAKLWNRLGATLANSDRSEEAVDAYHQALNIEPGFVRARYNVGITCMNLGAHKQAAEHFLVALNQQHKASTLNPSISPKDNCSSSIWTTLRMVCSFMGEHEVAKLVDDRNLQELNRFFEMDL